MIDKFDELVLSSTWVFAKTMPEIPHEYITRHKTDRNVFEWAVQFIRDYGFTAYWGTQPLQYFIRGDYYYWTMGSPVENTIIINRAELAKYKLVKGVWSIA